MILVRAAASGVGLGVGAHLTAQFVEPPLVSTIRMHALAFVGLNVLLFKQLEFSLVRTVAESLTLVVFYVLALTSSIAAYRLYFHRLSRFPGDTISKLTMFSWIPIDYKGKRSTHLQSLHAKYGPIVRTGPRELSIATVDALSALRHHHHHQTTTQKCREGPRDLAQIFSPSASSVLSETALANCRKSRTKTIAALSGDSRESVNTIQQCAALLMEHLQKKTQKEEEQEAEAGKGAEGEFIDIADSFDRFSLDVAMKLGLGKNLDLLKSDEFISLVLPLDEQLCLLNTVSNVPYCMEAVRLIPSSSRELDIWIAERVEKMTERAKGPGDTAEDSKQQQQQQPPPVDTASLSAEARRFILQTSAATRSTLTFCLSELLCAKEMLARVRREVKATSRRNGSRFEFPFLDACLEETLRLWPPFPSSMQKTTPAQGLKLSNKLTLPRNVVFSAPVHLIQRDPANFVAPNDFNPARWLTSEKKVEAATTSSSPHNVAAYAPFGEEEGIKDLVMRQCRIVIAHLLSTFDVAPAPDLTPATIRQGYRDQYTVAKAPCNVVLSRV